MLELTQITKTYDGKTAVRADRLTASVMIPRSQVDKILRASGSQHVFYKVAADEDTDDNATDFVVTGIPSPGEAEFIALPEPSSATLMLASLATLGWLARRDPR